MSLESDYAQRHERLLKPICERLTCLLSDYLAELPRIDRISTRAKSVDSFLTKAQTQTADGTPKYNNPIEEIQDQIGARVLVKFLADVEPVSHRVENYFQSIEVKQYVPDDEWKFGYFGKHYILFLPRDVVGEDEQNPPEFFELQIKTLFQHAWSETNHDIGYKPELPELVPDMARMLAFSSSQAWGGDFIMDDLFKKACGLLD